MAQRWHGLPGTAAGAVVGWAPCSRRSARHILMAAFESDMGFNPHLWKLLAVWL